MLQLSVVEGAVQDTTASQELASMSASMFEGVPVMTGASSSVMVTVKLEVDVLPASSVAV